MFLPMDFTKLFDKLTIKAENLEKTMEIIPHKDSFYSNELKVLDRRSRSIKKIESTVKESIRHQHDLLKKEYKEVNELIQNVNEKMLFLLSEIEKINTPEDTKTKQNNITYNILNEMKSPAASLFTDLNSPRISIDQYAKSPFAQKKKSKLQLKFSDFEAEITEEQFNNVPQYIRGRITLSDLQNFLDESVIKCFNSKYELFYKNRSALKPSEFELQLYYKEQSSYFKGQKFITMVDLSRTMGKNVDKRDEKFLQCLRFLQIIKEARMKAITCYIWI